MDNAFVIGIVSWIFPGFGHFQQGNWRRGLIIAGCIWAMFLIAVLSGGAYYPGFEFEDEALLWLLNGFSRAGNLMGAIVSWIIATDASPEVAASATFEYGGRLLEIAGLLNYLAVIDSIDILQGRKQ